MPAQWKCPHANVTDLFPVAPHPYSINMMQFVKQLMDAHQHPQMFMVSHYDSNHGSFTNAQTLVLSSFNIAVPDQYNEHVTIV